MSQQPATEIGTTTQAGVDDQEFAAEVAEQTSSDLKVEDAFDREAEGATSGVEAAQQDAHDAS